MVEQHGDQPVDSGSSPTPPLQSLSGWKVLPCDRSDIVDFVERWHYSKSINGVMIYQCFKLVDDSGQLRGAAIFGETATTGWKKYGEHSSDVLELRRLCCVDETPKNAESFMIGYCLRWLKKNSDYKVVLSYADPNHGHAGTIYRASNFTHVGMTPRGITFLWNGKVYHDRSLRTKYKGKLKPHSQRLVEAVASGCAIRQEQVKKHIYTYQLRSTQ